MARCDIFRLSEKATGYEHKEKFENVRDIIDITDYRLVESSEEQVGDLVLVNNTYWFYVEDTYSRYIGKTRDFDTTFIDGTIFRVCDVCGNVMVDGYMTEDGFMHYCSDECLKTDYATKEDYFKAYEADEVFYTEWY